MGEVLFLLVQTLDWQSSVLGVVLFSLVCIYTPYDKYVENVSFLNRVNVEI